MLGPYQKKSNTATAGRFFVPVAAQAIRCVITQKAYIFNCIMTLDFTINMQEIEDLQATSTTDALEQIFDRARRTIIGGGTVVLVRAVAGGAPSRFDEISNEEDLAAFRQRVFRYLE